MFRIENNDPKAIIKELCNTLYDMVDLAVLLSDPSQYSSLIPTVKRWYVYCILLDKSRLKQIIATVLIESLRNQDLKNKLEFEKLLTILDDSILDSCQEEIFKEVCKLGKRKEEVSYLFHFLSPEQCNQFMQIALKDPVFCENSMVKILQSMMAHPLSLSPIIDLNAKLLKGMLTNSAEFSSFIRNFITLDNVWDPIEGIFASDVMINIRFEAMRALLKHEKLDDVDRIMSGSLLIVTSFILMLIIKWLPEECIKKFFPEEPDDFLFKKIGGLALRDWSYIYPDSLPILLKMGIDPDARLKKTELTLLTKIIFWANDQSIGIEKNNESIAVDNEITQEDNESEVNLANSEMNDEARENNEIEEEVSGNAEIEEHNKLQIEMDKLIQSIPLLLSYGANPNFKVLMMVFPLLKTFMRSERMLAENCQPHDVDAALALMQYGAHPIAINKNKQNVLQVIYTKYPAIKEYIHNQGISDKQLEDSKSVFKKISMASFRREIQYVSSAQQVARSQYLNALILLANERHANREEKSILSHLPVEILIRVLNFSYFDVMNKKPEEGLALLDFIFSHPNKVKKMVSQPGGVSVFQTSDEEGKPQFTLFKTAKALTQDFVSLQRKLVPSQISKPTSLFGKAKQKLKIKSHEVVQKLDSKAVASVSEEIELIQKTAPQHLQAELNFYKKPESRAFLLEKVNDAPWAREVKPFLA